MANPVDDTIPVEDDTEPTPVVSRDQETIPAETVDIATDVDVLKHDTLDGVLTPKAVTPVTPVPVSVGDPVVALAKPKPAHENAPGSFVDRKYRLPTESEIKAAVEGTPTDEVAVVDPD